MSRGTWDCSGVGQNKGPSGLMGTWSEGGCCRALDGRRGHVSLGLCLWFVCFPSCPHQKALAVARGGEAALAPFPGQMLLQLPL